jgi:hypothetical protein
MKRPIQFLRNPEPARIPADFLAFLRKLGGPTLIVLDGEERERTRAMATLLHGNEPSGARAIHQWLLGGRRPRTKLLCLVASVHTALHEEALRHRSMPGQRDQNRCFRPPFDDAPGHIAGHFLELLQQHRPECLLDLHNTSGVGPAFGVVPHEDLAHEAIVSRFCSHLIVTDLRLGSLMEISGSPCPAVTVECGGARDPVADRIAREGLERYLLDEDVMGTLAGERRLDVYHHPVRLELEPGASIAYCDEPLPGMDSHRGAGAGALQLRRRRPRYAHRLAGGARHRGAARAQRRGEDVLAQYFTARDGRLYPSQKLRLFMVTTNPQIALSDCLLYASPEREHTRL